MEPKKGRRTSAELWSDRQPPKSRGEGSMFAIKGGTQWRATRTLRTVKNEKTGKWEAIQVSGTGATQALARKRLEENYKKRLVTMGQLPQSVLAERPKELRLETSTLLRMWLEVKSQTASKKERISTTVAYKYASLIRLHINPHIGTIPIRLLSKDDIRNLLSVTLPAKRKLKKNTVTGQFEKTDEPLLGSTPLRTVQNIINMALRFAYEERLILENPTLGIPTIEKAERPHESLDKKTWIPRRLILNLQGAEEEEARWILAFIGFRQSERLGITWDCFSNLSGANKTKPTTLEIRQQLERNPITGLLGIKPQAKTAAGNRIIPLDNRVATIFREQQKRQNEWKKSADWQPLKGLENLVLTTKTGLPIRHQTDNKQWHTLLGTINLRGESFVRQHAMRHIAISMMIEDGAPIEIVRAIAGHNSEEITRSIYTHIGTRAKIAPIEGLTNNLYREVDKKAEREARKNIEEVV